MSDTETEVEMDIAGDKITLLCTSQNFTKENGRQKNPYRLSARSN